jgi:hypothetical protein
MCSDFYCSVDEYGCLLHASVLPAAADQGLIKIRIFVRVAFLHTPFPMFWQGVTICFVSSASSQDCGSNMCSKIWSLSCIASWNSKTCLSLSCKVCGLVITITYLLHSFERKGFFLHTVHLTSEKQKVPVYIWSRWKQEVREHKL